MKWVLCAINAALLAATPAAASGRAAVSANTAAFGKLSDGRTVEVVTLSNAHGVRVRILTFGAILQSIVVPDREGRGADIVAGYATATDYAADTNHFGSTIGRYANRIAGGAFTLDGQRYALAQNNGRNALHGGPVGFDKALWTVAGITSGKTASVTLSHISPDGDQGYPGALTVTATFTLTNDNVLRIAYTATTTKPTIVNLTSHSYFNLRGEGSGQSILDHRLSIFADHYLPTDATAIPTGEIRAVSGTDFDFRMPVAIGARVRDGRETQLRLGRGYDHTYVLTSDPKPALRLAARVEDPGSGRVLEVSTDQPGLQFYSGNFLDGTSVGKSGKAYRQSDSFALEPQLFPDTPNRPAFGSARLDPGQTYHSTILYRFSVAGKGRAHGD